MKQWTGLWKTAGLTLLGGVLAVSLGVGLVTWPLADSLLLVSGFLADPWPRLSPAAAPAQAQTTPMPVETPSPSPAPAPTPLPTTAPVPESGQEEQPPEGWGVVTAQTFGQASGVGAISLLAGSIKNCTSVPDNQVYADATAGLPFAIDQGSDRPQVLILHTHATESYNLQSERFFDPAWSARTTDTARNMCAVGQNIADELNAAGIVTLHDETLHDQYSYNGSYAASKATVERYLSEYPSIKVVLDVHRDAIEREGSRVKPVTTIEGQPTAQVMIICGCDKNGNLPNCRKNLAFAGAWQVKMEQLYPTLTRPVLFDYRYYNQDLTTGSLLIEVGGHGNTLEEALNAGTFVGKALAALFTS